MMGTLHGILAELGIEQPAMHPEREVPHQPQWVVDEAFVPEVGKSYEVTFGKVTFNGELAPVLRRIRIDGAASDQWFDLDAGTPLDSQLRQLPVRGFRPIEDDARDLH
jgi:hypothetical protein